MIQRIVNDRREEVAVCVRYPGSPVEGRALKDGQHAACAIRVSIGPDTTEDEIGRFIDAFTAAQRKFRARAA